MYMHMMNLETPYCVAYPINRLNSYITALFKVYTEIKLACIT